MNEDVVKTVKREVSTTNLFRDHKINGTTTVFNRGNDTSLFLQGDHTKLNEKVQSHKASILGDGLFDLLFLLQASESRPSYGHIKRSITLQ